jgi:hypothetical protein
MAQKTKLVRLKCIRSQVFDTHGVLVLRVPADATESEIRGLSGNEWHGGLGQLPWHQTSERELNSRGADDPLCLDIQAITEVAAGSVEPHGILVRRNEELEIEWPQ